MSLVADFILKHSVICDKFELLTCRDSAAVFLKCDWKYSVKLIGHWTFNRLWQSFKNQLRLDQATAVSRWSTLLWDTCLTNRQCSIWTWEYMYADESKQLLQPVAIRFNYAVVIRYVAHLSLTHMASSQLAGARLRCTDSPNVGPQFLAVGHRNVSVYFR